MQSSKKILCYYSAISLVNTKPQNKQMHCCISPRRTCIPCGYTMKISSMYHRLLIYDVKRTTKIDGMGLFKLLVVTDCPSQMATIWLVRRPLTTRHCLREEAGN